jgi:hypothetical protein
LLHSSVRAFVTASRDLGAPFGRNAALRRFRIVGRRGARERISRRPCSKDASEPHGQPAHGCEFRRGDFQSIDFRCLVRRKRPSSTAYVSSVGRARAIPTSSCCSGYDLCFRSSDRPSWATATLGFLTMSAFRLTYELSQANTPPRIHPLRTRPSLRAWFLREGERSESDARYRREESESRPPVFSIGLTKRREWLR